MTAADELTALVVSTPSRDLVKGEEEPTDSSLLCRTISWPDSLKEQIVRCLSVIDTAVCG